MASNQFVFFALFGAILCSSLFDFAAAQWSCQQAGGQCVEVGDGPKECPAGQQEIVIDCDNPETEICCRSPENDSLLNQECRAEGGRCMRECRNGTMPHPDIDCPRGGQCCVPGGGPSSRRGPPPPPRRGRPTPPPKRRRPSPPPTTMPPPEDDWDCMQQRGECKWRCRNDEQERPDIHCPMMGKCCTRRRRS